MKKVIILILAGCVIALVTLHFIGAGSEPTPSIPTPRQVQEFLKAQNHPRYDPGKIDGVPGPKTCTAWVNWTVDQIANEAFEQCSSK